MVSDRFYADLPIVDDFAGVCRLGNYAGLPDDWHIVVADVQDSTGAIRAGRYKAVNILGVSVISAVLNAVRPQVVPYVFGGDGAALCIPEATVAPARRALLATRAMAARQFDMHLRIGIVPARDVIADGYRVLVARHRVSGHVVQAAFAGGGVEHAESLIKDPETAGRYTLDTGDEEPAADFSGLECRWANVPSRHGETIALIVKSLATSITDAAAFYDTILRELREIYGDDDRCRPVYVGGLHTTYDPGKLQYETGVRTWPRARAARLPYLLRILVQNAIGWVLMTFRLNAGGVPWGDYKPDLVRNSDFRKFDGVLRAVLSGTAAQREELARRLEARHRAGECVYGIHASDSALITCLISSRAHDHYHFIDGADGGYAMAAVGLKEQLRRLTAQR